MFFLGWHFSMEPVWKSYISANLDDDDDDDDDDVFPSFQDVFVVRFFRWDRVQV